VAATYDALLRLLCPHVLGRKSGRLRVFCYQFGGNSNSGLAVVSEGMGGWRCLAVDKLSQIELRADAWHTEPRSPRQTRIVSMPTLSPKTTRKKGSEAVAAATGAPE